MKLLKRVVMALISCAMLAGTAFTTVASAENNEGYAVYGVKTEMDSQEYYVISIQNIPEEWVNNYQTTALIHFGDIDTKKWSEAELDFVCVVIDERYYSAGIMLGDKIQEEAINSYIAKTEDNIYAIEMFFPADSKYMAEFSKYNWVNIYLTATVSDGDDLKQVYYTHEQKGVDSPVSTIASVSWQDWTVPADSSDPTEEAPKPTEEPAEPTEEPTELTEEPIESAEPEPTEELVEEPAETEAPEALAPEKPETAAPEAPAEPALPASTSANKGNPDTGAAVAVMPLLIAGAGAAALSRKRK